MTTATTKANESDAKKTIGTGLDTLQSLRHIRDVQRIDAYYSTQARPQIQYSGVCIYIYIQYMLMDQLHKSPEQHVTY